MVQKFGDHHRLDVWNSRNNARFSISTGAGFLPSTLSFHIRPMVTRSQYQQSLMKLMLIHVFRCFLQTLIGDQKSRFSWQSCNLCIPFGVTKLFFSRQVPPRLSWVLGKSTPIQTRYVKRCGRHSGARWRGEKKQVFQLRKKTAKKRNRGKIHGQHFNIQWLLLGCG